MPLKEIRTPVILSVFTIVAIVFTNSSGMREFIDQSAITFAVLKTGNAVISVFQESTVSVNLIFGGELAIGQLLDPINDLVEKSANIVFAGMVMYTVLLFASLVAQSVWYKISLAILAGAWLATYFFRKKIPILESTCKIALLMPLAIIFISIGSSLVDILIVKEKKEAFLAIHEKVMLPKEKELEIIRPDTKDHVKKPDSAQTNPAGKSLLNGILKLPGKMLKSVQNQSGTIPKTPHQITEVDTDLKEYFQSLLDYMTRYMAGLILEIIIFPLLLVFFGKKLFFNRV